MTAGTEVVCSDVLCKAEIKEKFVEGLETSDLNEVGAISTVDGNVGGNSNGNVGGIGKDDTGDSSFVFVNGSIGVIAADPDDTGGVNVDAVAPICDSADEVDQFKKEELGIESRWIPVDPSSVETNGIDIGFAAPRDPDVKTVKEVKLENGSTADPSVLLEGNDVAPHVKGHISNSTEEEEEVNRSTDEVEDANGFTKAIATLDGIVSRVAFDPQSTLNPMEIDQVTVLQSDATNKQADETTQSAPTPDLTNTRDESISTPNPVSYTECEVLVYNEPEPLSTVIDKVERQVTAECSGKPSENFECQVTADGTESFGTPIKEHEYQMSVGVSEFIGNSVENQEHPASVDSSESNGNYTDGVDSMSVVESDKKLEEHPELVVISSKVNVEAKPNHVCSGIKAEHQTELVLGSNTEAEGIVIGYSTESEENPDSGVVQSEDSDTPVNRLVEKFDEIVEIGETQISSAEANEGISSVFNGEKEKSEEKLEKLEKQVEGSSVSLMEVTESIGLEGNLSEIEDHVKIEDEILESQIVGLDKLQDDLNLENNAAESVIEAEAPLVTEINLAFTHKDTTSPLELSSCTDRNQEGFPLEGSAEDVEILLSTEIPDSQIVVIDKVQDNLNLEDNTAESVNEAEAPLVTKTNLLCTLENTTLQNEHSSCVEGTQEGFRLEGSAEEPEILLSIKIPESQIVVLDKVKDDLNLENNTAESVKAEAPLVTETNFPSTHEDTTSQHELSSCVDGTQEGFRLDGGAEDVEILHSSEIQESQIVVFDKVQDDLKLENNTAESVNEAEAPLVTETNLPSTHEDPTSQHELSSCVDGTQEGFRLERSAEDVEIMLSTDSVASECKSGDILVKKGGHSLSNPDDLAAIELDVEFDTHMVIENVSVDCGTGIENIDAPEDDKIESEVKDAPFGDYSPLSLPDAHVNPGTVIEFGSIGHHETVPNIHNDVIAVPDVVNGDTKPACGADSDNPKRNVDGSDEDGNSDQISCPEVEDMASIPSDEIRISSAEVSVNDAPDVQNEEADVLPYNFLIRIPRFEDETMRDQIRKAQLQVEEKTCIRDAIRAEINGKRAGLKAHNEAFHAAKLEETAARRLVKLKRQEIDSIQTIINRIKNVTSVEDIDGRIHNMEHMIQHETLLLKDEKQLIREIKQLKTLRDQLASNIGNHDEVQQALQQKDQIEESMKVLRKELDSLKANVSKAEAAVTAVGKKYDEESRKERELQAQFRAADDVRQKAYAHLDNLKKQLYDKNQNFRLYKETVMAARNFASVGDKDGLHRLCGNQVEAFMEQWNNNNEFRNEYVSRCNMNNTNRRQRTLEGGSLASDEALPVLPRLPDNVNGKVNGIRESTPIEVKSVTVSVVPTHKQGNMVSSTEIKHEDSKSIKRKNQKLKTKNRTKSILGSEIVKVAENENMEEEQNTATEEEMELARKAEELRKEEAAAKLKEQRRLEEKAKAAEAMERKKRAAEKAQFRAELRARKEAEQKEKEREKRLRKKEKKKANREGSINGDEAASSASSNEVTTKETENISLQKTENVSFQKKNSRKPPPHFFSKQLKQKPAPLPPAIRNRKRWQQWGNLAVVAMVVVFLLVLFLLGNTDIFHNLRVSKTI